MTDHPGEAHHFRWLGDGWSACDRCGAPHTHDDESADVILHQTAPATAPDPEPIDWRARALTAEAELVSLRRQLRCAGLHAPEPFTHSAEDPAVARTGARWEREHQAALDLLMGTGDAP